jgi:hypothetical protein
MWETSRFRSKGLGGTIGQPENTGTAKKKKRREPRRHLMKRVHAQLVASQGWGTPATIVPARLVLSDMGPLSATLFASVPLELEQQVTLTLNLPQPFLLRGRVTYCRIFEVSSRIHCKQTFPYRIQVEFDFLNDGEMLAVREYLEGLQRSMMPKAA